MSTDPWTLAARWAVIGGLIGALADIGGHSMTSYVAVIVWTALWGAFLGWMVGDVRRKRAESKESEQ